MGNFLFLKETDSNLFQLADEAEKLFRDSYFDQCVAQTRKFGENVWRKVLGDYAMPNDTFDNMLATLKDKPQQNEVEKEFLDDLYFLKKSGNFSVHATKVKNDAKTALECLQRAFEIAINYSIYKDGATTEITSLQYDEQLLATGTKSKEKTLQQKYVLEMQKDEKKKQKHNEKVNKDFDKVETKAKPKRRLKKNSNVEEDVAILKSMIKKKKKKSWSKDIKETLIAIVIICLIYLLFFK